MGFFAAKENGEESQLRPLYYSNKKFGTRYPDGVEPSHTVVCYHEILFNAEYLGEGDAQP